MYSTIQPIIEPLVSEIAGNENEFRRAEVSKMLIDFAEEIKEQTLSEVTALRKGVELRDQFAMSIINALLQKSANVYYEGIARSAYNIADQMLEARKQN